MHLLISVKLDKEGIETSQVFLRNGRVLRIGVGGMRWGMYINHRRDRHAQNHVVGCSSRKAVGTVGRELADVIVRKFDCIEPECLSFMPASLSVTVCSPLVCVTHAFRM